MSLRRADVANGSFGVDQMATAISAPGRWRPTASPIELPDCGRPTELPSSRHSGKPAFGHQLPFVAGGDPVARLDLVTPRLVTRPAGADPLTKRRKWSGHHRHRADAPSVLCHRCGRHRPRGQVALRQLAPQPLQRFDVTLCFHALAAMIRALRLRGRPRLRNSPRQKNLRVPGWFRRLF